MKVLVVGEDFGRSPVQYHNDRYALSGASGRRLAALAEVDLVDFLVATERTNVVELPEHWLVPTAVAAGIQRIARQMGGRRTILLGSRVAKAFGVYDARQMEWRPIKFVTKGNEMADGLVARMPHPSGRNLWWNDPANVARAAVFWREAITSG